MKGMTNASPGVGQFAAGKLGTIKGGTADGSVQAQEDGTGTVVGWSGKADKSALDATDTKVTQIQAAVGDCFNEVALGSDGKSLDFTAVDGQVNNVVLPSATSDFKIYTGTLDSLFVNGVLTKTLLIQMFTRGSTASQVTVHDLIVPSGTKPVGSTEIVYYQSSSSLSPITLFITPKSTGIKTMIATSLVSVTPVQLTSYPSEISLNSASYLLYTL